MRRKKLLGITLCAVLTIGALLCCMQDASARETLLISGNADLYPIESYDRGRECYVGLLPELYERLSEQTGYDLVYLPYSKNTTQAQQTANRQADIISAYPSGAVDSGAMRRQVLLCTIEHDGAERAIYVGFTNALTPELAGALAQALEDLSGAESIGVLADYTNSSGAEAYRTRWLITLAALIAAMLAAAVALIVFARKKRAEQKTNALIDPRYGIGNDRFYLHCVETLLPAPLRSLTYVVCVGCDMPSLEHRCGEAEREELFCRAAEYLRRGCAREDYLACVGRGMFALVCQCGSREAAQQRAEGLIRGLDGYLAGFRAEYAGAFRAGICSLEENPDYSGEAALYSARQGCAYAFGHGMLCAFGNKRMVGESEQLDRLRRRTAEAVAAEVGVDAVYAEVLPEDKAAFIRQEKEKGHTVIMVGDGVNDSPALSEADAGIAISTGAAIAREIADITVSSEDLFALVTLRRLSQALMERIHGSYRFIVGFNLTLIALGVAGVLPPTTSALLHNGSTLGISLRNMTDLLDKNKS